MELIIKNFENYSKETLPALFIHIELELYKLKRTENEVQIEFPNGEQTITPDYE